MSLFYSRSSDGLEDDISAQVAALRRDVANLTKTVSRRGLGLAEDARSRAGGLYENVSEQLGETWPVIRKQAQAVQGAAREHPATTTMIGLLVACLVVSLLARR
jgi:hypothetical protein